MNYYTRNNNIKLTIFVFFILLTICSETKAQMIENDITKGSYIYYDIFSEFDFEMTFYKDSTFVLRDRYGCNCMYQKGKYIAIDSSHLLLLNTTNIHYNTTYEVTRMITYDDNNCMCVSTRPFLFDNDTLSIINQDSLEIKKIKFYISNENVADLRVKATEDYIISQIGYETYVNNYGKGNLNEARRKLRDCK